MVIHDLNLHTMSEDLAGFKPNMYRLMQLSGKVGKRSGWIREYKSNEDDIQL